jgi:hypothetical protein
MYFCLVEDPDLVSKRNLIGDTKVHKNQEPFFVHFVLIQKFEKVIFKISFMYFLLDQKVPKSQGLKRTMNKFFTSFHYNQRNSSAAWRTQTTLIMSVTLHQEFSSCFFKGHKKQHNKRFLETAFKEI